MIDLWLPPKPAIIRPAPKPIVKASFLPGMFPVGVAASVSMVGPPKAATFNGTDEQLTRTISTSAPNLTQMTVSFWAKSSVGSKLQPIIASDNGGAGGSDSYRSVLTDKLDYFFSSGGNLGGRFTSSAEWISTNTWHHYVFQIETSQGTESNRCRIYVDGVQKSTSSASTISLNETFGFWTNGSTIRIGRDIGATDWYSGKLSFIDVIYNASLTPTSFAFNDSGTWTRKPYAGSYGSYGFSLDFADTFNDAGPNSQDFTGSNMDATNLSAADMPPFTN